MSEILPHKTIYPSNILDKETVSLVRNIFPKNIVDASSLQEGGSQTDIDGYIRICDEKGYERATITVQIKHLTNASSEDIAFYDIPSTLYGYAGIHKGEVVIFIAGEPEKERFFWKYISLNDVKDIELSENNTQKSFRHHFYPAEICSKANVTDTVKCWKELYAQRMNAIQDDEQQAERFVKLQRASFSSISTGLHGVTNSHICRSQLDELKQWMLQVPNNNEKRVCLLVGNAGVGKSALLKEFIDAFDGKSAKFVCIKADSIEASSNPITLERLRNAITYYSSQSDKVILIVDQIDALSQCLSNDRNHLNAILSILSSLKEWPNVRAVVSCRKYDLEYDASLNNIKDLSETIELGELTDEEVVFALNKLEGSLGKKLSKATLQILKTVQTLNTFCILYRRNPSKLDFSNSIELYDALWNEYVCKVKAPFNAIEIEKSLFFIATTIQKSETLKPRLCPTTEQQRTFDYLASCGIISIDGCTVSFFHQTFYDYTLARQYVASGKSFVEDIENDFQGLELRTIVKAILEYEYGHNETIFINDARHILTSPRTRLHIKLLTISNLAFSNAPHHEDKKLINDVCGKDEKLMVYFLRGVHDNGWFATIKKLVKGILPNIEKENQTFFPIVDCLSRYAFNNPDDVFKLVKTINDERTRLFTIAYILRSPNDYRNDRVLEAYNETKPQNVHFVVDLIKDAFKTNEKFAFTEAERILSEYLLSDKKENRHDGYELVEVLFPSLLSHRPKELLMTLHNSIVGVIEKTSHSGHHGFSVSGVFSDIYTEDYVSKILNMYENLLTQFSSDVLLIRPIVKKLMSLNNETSVSMAFATMTANPRLYDDIIRQLQLNTITIEHHLHSDIEYFYLNMLKAWYLTLDKKDAVEYQNKVLSYPSTCDFIPNKDRRFSPYLYPNLWRDKWVLICNTLPVNGVTLNVRRCSQELKRRFGEPYIVERPDHTIHAAVCCGGVVSDEVYPRWPISNWLSSFLKLNEKGWCRKGRYPISLNAHADAFKKCVANNPAKFRDFVFKLTARNDIKDIYKEAGVAGLLIGGNEPNSLWEITKPYITINYATENSYSFCQIAEYYIQNGNEHLDDILRLAEAITKISFDKKSSLIDSSQNDSSNLERRATHLLESAINSPQGHAMKLLIRACAIPERRVQIYNFISSTLPYLSDCLRTLPLHYLYVTEYFDETLYFPLMKEILKGLGPEALAIRGDAIQWCYYHKNDIVKEYIDKVESNPLSQLILSQIYFYGLSSEKNLKDCKDCLERILSLGDECIISKIVEISMKSYRLPELYEYSKIFLERYATDDREKVADAYCWYCSELPTDAFDFYCSIAKTWAGKRHREIHEQLDYIMKCVSEFPKKCYEFIKSQNYSVIDSQWSVDNDVVKVLLEIYKKLKEDDARESMNEIMDLFDEYIYKGNRMVLDAVEKMN